MARKTLSSIAKFRQYCCLRLDEKIVMPALLSELHDIVSSNYNVFWWADPNGNISDFYVEDPGVIACAERYMRDFANRGGRDSGFNFREFVRSGGVGNSLAFGKKLYATELFHEVFRPASIHTLIRASVSLSARPGGTLTLTRAAGERPFSVGDEHRLAAIVPFVAHALAQPPTSDITFVEPVGDTTGVIILDRVGKIEYASSQGRLLMYLATAEYGDSQRLRIQLERAYSCSDRVRHGLPGPPPSFSIQNGWGKFQFRCYFLDVDSMDRGLVSVLISRLIPQELKVLKRVHSLGLSARQAEYCMQLCRGLSHSQASQAIGITMNTAKGYFKNVCDKLGISSRSELLALVFGSEASGASHVIESDG